MCNVYEFMFRSTKCLANFVHTRETRGQCTGLIAAVSRKFTAFFKAFEQVLRAIALWNTPQNITAFFKAFEQVLRAIALWNVPQNILQLNFNGAASNRAESDKYEKMISFPCLVLFVIFQLIFMPPVDTSVVVMKVLIFSWTCGGELK